jgi:glycosyltransferase involved in cell wall biosynthesis
VKTIAVLVSNDLTHDQRVRKTCDVLRAAGLNVVLIGRELDDSQPIQREYETVRLKLPFTRGALFYAALQRALLRYLGSRRNDWDAIWANDLDTLWPAYQIAKDKDIPLIYDSHEYFTEAAGLTGRPFPKWVWTQIERSIFPKLKHVITVNESIASIYREKYNVPVRVVRNVPSVANLPDFNPTRAELGLPEGNLVILQGAFMDKDRGVVDMVRAMKLLPDVHLLLVGAGEEWVQAGELRESLGLQDRITILPKQPYERLVGFTRSADAGISLDKGTHFNYYYSLPNKLFDYIHAGIPVVASPMPEVRRVVEGYEIGVLVRDWSPEAIAEAVRSVFSSPQKRWMDGVSKAQNDFRWERESEVIREILVACQLSSGTSS